MDLPRGAYKGPRLYSTHRDGEMLERLLELGLQRDSKFGIDRCMGKFGLVVGH